jgi:hypothetical protein
MEQMISPTFAVWKLSARPLLQSEL